MVLTIPVRLSFLPDRKSSFVVALTVTLSLSISGNTHRLYIAIVVRLSVRNLKMVHIYTHIYIQLS